MKKFKTLIFSLILLQGCGEEKDSPSSSAEKGAVGETVTTPAGTSTTSTTSTPVPVAAEKDPCPSADKHKALFLAVADGNIQLARCLIEKKGARVNQRTSGGAPNDTGISLLCVAISENHPAMIKFLVSKGALVNDLCSPRVEFYSIHYAAARETETLQALIESGADIDRKTYTDEWTPVIMATTANKLSNVELLVSRGAKFNARSKDGQTAFSIAQRSGYDRIVRYLQSVCPYFTALENLCVGEGPERRKKL